jgi:tetrahydromethanopterin S-methyltransferase subunit G
MSDLEKTNLEVHVELCTSRFIRINERLDQIEKTLEKICDELLVNHKSQMKTVIMTAGTVIAGLLSTLVVVLMRS